MTIMTNGYLKFFPGWNEQSDERWVTSIIHPNPHPFSWIQIETGVDEKDFFNNKFSSEFGYKKLKNGNYLMRQKQPDNTTNIFIMKPNGEEVATIKNCSLHPSQSDFVNINDRSYILMSIAIEEEGLQNRVDIDQFEEFVLNPRRYGSVTYIKDIGDDAYYLTDQEFPRSLVDQFLSVWESFDGFIENGLPKFNLIDLFVEKPTNYKPNLGLVRIDSKDGQQTFIPGKMTEKPYSQIILNEEIVLLEYGWFDILYSMRSWKVLWQGIKSVEYEPTTWEGNLIELHIYIEFANWSSDNIIIRKESQFHD